MAKPTIYLNSCPDVIGHFRFLDAEGVRLDTASGPRQSMFRIYCASGYDVRDERGRSIEIDHRGLAVAS